MREVLQREHLRTNLRNIYEGNCIYSLCEPFLSKGVDATMMHKLRTFFVFILLVPCCLAQPPQSNNNSSSGYFNSGSNGIIPLSDSIKAVEGEFRLDDKSRSGDLQNNSLLREMENYKAAKASVKQNPSSRTASKSEENQLEQSVIKMKSLVKTDKDLIEANILYYDQGNYNALRFPQLQQALQLNPSHAEGIRLWIANSLVTGDTVSLKMAIQRARDLGHIPQEITCYSKDLLASVPEKTVLITHGTWDTYGAINEMMLQNRKHLEVISLDLLQSPQYRQLLSNKGFIVPLQSKVDIAYFKDFVNMNPTKKFAFSMTIPSAYLMQFESQLAPNGLVFLYPDAMNEDQWLLNNEQFLESFSYLDCGSEPSKEFEHLQGNYEPMLTTLEVLSSNKDDFKKGKIANKRMKIRRNK